MLRRQPRNSSVLQKAVRLRFERLEDRWLLTFGDDGIVTADVSPGDSDWVEAVAIQSDGKIVAVGNVGIARFNTDGSLDATFDGDGVLPVPGYLTDVEIQADGKIVVGGRLNVVGGSSDFLVRRFHADGSPDTSFDGDGIATTNILKGSSDFAYGIALQPPDALGRQKIVAVGEANPPNLQPRQWTVVRYNADGNLDNTFDGDGKLTTAFTKGKSPGTARGVLIQPDGKIVVVGSAVATNGWSDFAAARYNTNGSLDSSFGVGGKVTTDLKTEHSLTNSSDIANDVVLQADGKLVVVGSVGTGPYFAIVRYDAAGNLDPSFAGDGKQVLPNPFGQGDRSTFQSVALEPPDATGSQKIVAAGSGNATYVARFQANGALDTSFDDDGWEWFVFSDPAPEPTSDGDILALQPDGRIVIGGAANRAAGYDFAVARLNPDGSFDAEGTPCHRGWICSSASGTAEAEATDAAISVATGGREATTTADFDAALAIILTEDFQSTARRRK